MNLSNSQNKMKITYEEPNGHDKECKNPLELTDSQKILHEEDRKHANSAKSRNASQNSWQDVT